MGSEMCIRDRPSTFEFVTARVSHDSASCIVVALYRPGSSAVTASFFAELANLLERLSTYSEPLVLAGDINIRLERVGDPKVVEFRDLLVSYGLTHTTREVRLTSSAPAMTCHHRTSTSSTSVCSTIACYAGRHRCVVLRQSSPHPPAGVGGRSTPTHSCLLYTSPSPRDS